MRLAVAQLRPSVGHVEGNFDRHLALTELAVCNGAKLVVFPELSMTGYEPSRAAEVARYSHDSSFEKLQSACNRVGVSIGVGVPLRTSGLPRISTLLFRPNIEPLIYSKMSLHPDEEPIFQPGIDSPSLILAEPPIALAICFELSVPHHAHRAKEAGAIAYIASVAKTASGVVQAGRRLSAIAADFSMAVFMANCLGVLDGAECTGGSSAWDPNGEMIAQLDDENEGVIVVDLESGEAVTAILSVESQ